MVTWLPKLARSVLHLPLVLNEASEIEWQEDKVSLIEIVDEVYSVSEKKYRTTIINRISFI